MPERREYIVMLPAPLTVVRAQHPTGSALRNPAPEETESLAEVLLDAYRGTIDDEGETTDDALVEIESFLAGEEGDPLLNCSWVLDSSDTLLSACLVSLWHGEPLISYIVTRSTWKQRGLASFLLRQSLLSLQDGGYSRVRAFITDGNDASRGLLTHFGFVPTEG
jgi:hypothetical protein